MVAAVHIQLLGRPQVLSGDAKGFPRKGFQLLAVLLSANGKPMERERIADLLWDDVDQATALANLRQLLTRLSRALPGEAGLILANGRSLSLDQGLVISDVGRLVDCAMSADLATRWEAARAYQGTLLEGEELSEGMREWSKSRDVELQQRFFALAESCLDEMTRYGRAAKQDILDIVNHMTGVAPDREASYRTGIDALGRCGYSDAARALFETLRRSLANDFDAQPEAATMSILRRTSAQPASVPVALSPSIVTALPRVAFLPPELPGGGAQQSLCTSFIADVANGLAQFRTFVVLAPHSSFAYMRDGVGIDRSLLRPDYTVESWLVPGEETLAMRLTRVETGEVVWAADHSIELRRLTLSYRQLSTQVSRQLSSEIARDQLATSGPTDPGAYVHYLLGQATLSKCTLPFLRRARGEFKRAVTMDARFAAAHARIAQTLQLEWLMLGGKDPYLLTQAKAAANTAIDLDPSGAGGHWMAAVVALYQRDYEFAAQTFLTAETLHPHSADLLLQHADALAHFGDVDAAWHRFERAISLNPYAPDIYWWAGASIAFKRADFAEAVRLCDLMESDEPVLRLLAASHGLLGNVDAARLYGDRLLETYPGMSARDIVGAQPDKAVEATELFLEGLRRAGIN